MFIKVKVSVLSKREKVDKKSENSYFISVKEPAERNLANNRIREIMASLYNININKVRIVNGHHNSSKILSINL